jgi:hypothetical protein
MLEFVPASSYFLFIRSHDKFAGMNQNKLGTDTVFEGIWQLTFFEHLRGFTAIRSLLLLRRYWEADCQQQNSDCREAYEILTSNAKLTLARVHRVSLFSLSNPYSTCLGQDI